VAKDNKATIGCPITTGIFAWIAAHAAEEDLADGKKRVTPYWRTLKTGGELNAKYPGGVAALKRNSTPRGIALSTRGKASLVEIMRTSLARV
jgi:hypothetical protein